MKLWTLDETYQSVRPFRIEVIRRLGFTERQADFLAHVLVFSGVFMERQYCRFAGLTHGRKSVDFLRTLVDRGYATVIAPGKTHSGRLYHLHHKPLYEAIGLPNSRNRRRAALGRFIERVMLLDVVLRDKKHFWLGTEKDKVGYFQKLEVFGRKLTDDVLPRAVFGLGNQRTTRYFPDKLPIGIERDGRRLVFVFLVRQPNPLEFRMFLARHAELLVGLFEWTIRIVIPRRFEKAKNLHIWALRDDLTKQLHYRTADEFKDYLEAKHNPPPVTSTTPPPALTDGARRFASARFQALERVWLQGGPAAFSTLYMDTIRSRVRSLRSPLPDSLFAPLTRPARSHQKEQLPERPEVTPLGTKKVPRGALYLASDNQLMAVPIRVGINPKSGPFRATVSNRGSRAACSFAVAADGQRFLAINRKLEGRISILTNWEATLRP